MDYRGMEDDGIVGWMESLRLDGGGDDGDGRDGVSSSSSSSILPQLVGWMESLRLDAGGNGDGRDGVEGVGVRGSGDGVSSSSSTLPHLLQSVTGLLRGMVLEEEEDHEHDMAPEWEEDHEHDMASEWEDIDHDMVSEDDEDIDHDMISEEEDIDHVEE